MIGTSRTSIKDSIICYADITGKRLDEQAQKKAGSGKHFRRKNAKKALPGVDPPRTAKVKCLHGFLRVLFCTKGKIQCPPKGDEQGANKKKK